MIEIKNLEKSYNNIKILDGINLTIKDGEIYGLVGKSGAGKSTLLRCINGLEKFDSGILKINEFEIKNHSDKEIREFRKNIGMIFQNFSLMERKNVYENIALPMKCWGYDKNYIDKRVRELLRLVDIEDKIKEKPRSLSGGQKQRVAIARALSLSPKILLCDEATSALDPKTTESIISLLKKINEDMGIAIVFVTHQMSVVKQLCHRVSILENGKISADGDVRDLFLNLPQSLKNILGKNYLDVIPSLGKNIKITYDPQNIDNRILSNMVKKLNVDFSIVWSNSEKYRNTLVQTLIINVDDKNLDTTINYLKDWKLNLEVLNNGQ